MRLIWSPVTDSPVISGVVRVEAELTRGSDWNMILGFLACPISNRLALMPWRYYSLPWSCDTSASS